jgi:predicted DNA-binding transcriptional regulator AlpA
VSAEASSARRERAEEIAELVAERVAAMLGIRQGHAELIDAHQVARILGCRRSWVYEHKGELPLVRLGGGSRPRLRFERAKVEAIAAVNRDEEAEPQPTIAPRRRPRRRYGHRPPMKLLEIKGRAP